MAVMVVVAKKNGKQIVVEIVSAAGSGPLAGRQSLVCSKTGVKGNYNVNIQQQGELGAGSVRRKRKVME